MFVDISSAVVGTTENVAVLTRDDSWTSPWVDGVTTFSTYDAVTGGSSTVQITSVVINDADTATITFNTIGGEYAPEQYFYFFDEQDGDYSNEVYWQAPFLVATPDNPASDLTGVTEVLDLSDAPDGWKLACDSTDGEKIRVFDHTSGDELPRAVINFTNDLSGNVSGFLFIARAGTRSASGAQPVRVQPALEVLTSYIASDAYGSDYAFPNSRMSAPMMDGVGGTITDYSGNGRTGTIAGNPTSVAGPFGTAIEFDGTGDSVNFGSDGSLLYVNGGFALKAWIKTTRLSVVRMHVLGHRGGSPDRRHFIGIESGKAFGEVRSSTTNRTVTGSTSIYDGNWHQICGTFDPSTDTSKIYVDGVEDGTLNGFMASSWTSSGNFSSGRDLNNNAYEMYGAIAQVRKSTNLLSSAFIAHNFANESDIEGFWGDWTYSGDSEPPTPSFKPWFFQSARVLGAA